MRRDARIGVTRLLLALAVLAAAGTPAAASVTRVAARDTLARAALAAAQPGDTLVLATGVHRGPTVASVTTNTWPASPSGRTISAISPSNPSPAWYGVRSPP